MTSPTVEPGPRDRGPGIQSVERAARILLSFGDLRPPMSINDIAGLLGVHKSTASRLVGTLVRLDLLAGGDGGPIRLGPAVARLGRIATGGADLAELAGWPMADLAAQTGETVTLSVREGAYAVTIAQSGGTHRVGVRSWVGARTPLAHTADGKVLLAFVEAGAEDEDEGEDTSPSRALADEIALVRRDGRATARGELEENLYGVAVPLRDPDGRCLAALCVSGPSYRVTADRFDILADQARAAADRITAHRQHYLEQT
jgi:IclR family transcriptional regulator, acetate operon repressor